MPPKVSQWFLTYPKCDISLDDILKHLNTIDSVIHYVIASEKHKDGSSHRHVYVKYVDGILRNKASTLFDVGGYHGNYQPVRSPKSVIKYCTKEDNYLSNFDVKLYSQKKGKVSVETLKTKTTKQALTDGDISFLQTRQYQFSRSIMEEPYEHPDVRGIWIHGPTGTGKSRIAREHTKLMGYKLYNKGQNRWFDGYDGEEVILIDDFDQMGVGLHHLLKIWTDRYACNGEVKGSKVNLVHKEFLVTSNFTIEELFADLPEVTRQAIKRRFREVYLHDYSSFDPLTLCKTLPSAMGLKRHSSVGDNKMVFTEAEVYSTADKKSKVT